MTMTPRVRRFVLTTHVIGSVGWLGAVGAFLALAVAGLASQDPQTIRAAYPSMELIGWFVIVPCSLAALATGLVQSLGTEWGLFRYYWVLTKFVLTIGATGLLLLHMSVVRQAAGTAAGPFTNLDFHSLQVRLVFDAGLAMLVLLTNTILSVYKPWGLTRYGRIDQRRRSGSVQPGDPAAASATWVYAATVVGAILLIVILHLTGVVGHH